jgi:hypothetical protein
VLDGSTYAYAEQPSKPERQYTMLAF